MDVPKVVVVLVFVLFGTNDVHGTEQKVAETLVSKLDEEKILSKLCNLQDEFVKLRSALKKADLKLSGVVGVIDEQNRTVAQIRSTLTRQGESIAQKLNEVVNQLSHNASVLKAQSETIKNSTNTQHDQIVKELQTLVSKKDVASLMISSGLNIQNVLHQSCKEKLADPSGKYIMQPTSQDMPFLVYCDQAVFGGGWLVIQHRYNGSVDFFRNWSRYRDGFGNVNGEFWLGLERVHRLTSARPHELLIELKDFDGNYTYARYDLFQIGSEAEQYALKELGEYTGTAGDALTFHKGKKFTTYDRDNDEWSGNTAIDRMGPWWYGGGAYSNLNGLYQKTDDKLSMYWTTKYNNSHAYTRMMIREK